MSVWDLSGVPATVTMKSNEYRPEKSAIKRRQTLSNPPALQATPVAHVMAARNAIRCIPSDRKGRNPVDVWSKYGISMVWQR